ncbi:PP2C family protein-serine/threonine phosphatase [Paenibacillus andongensis]|uniref:PP2C family protein-serine/threonine phosphatase n=1 Tax=Paenibacillus andongensis TaxID=2975482 RepID=UPI0021BACF2F|nr:protein phosphatase 2C domain-containing protein [Paenibacillus andongensis]
MLNNGSYISEEQQKTIIINGNSLNPESFVSAQYSANNAAKGIFAVSDGMGGHNAGEVASLLAVAYLNNARNYILNTEQIEASVERYQQYVNQVNREICNKAHRNSGLDGMGATLSSLILKNDSVVAVNIGDSRVYKYDGENLLQMTKDHTEGQRLLDLKLLTVKEVESFKSRKALSRYLGMNDDFAILKGEATDIFPIHQREWFLLCSDGLSDVVFDSMIEMILGQFYKFGNIKEAVQTLVKAALDGVNGRHGGSDNITAMIVEISPSSESCRGK